MRLLDAGMPRSTIAALPISKHGVQAVAKAMGNAEVRKALFPRRSTLSRTESACTASWRARASLPGGRPQSAAARSSRGAARTPHDRFRKLAPQSATAVPQLPARVDRDARNARAHKPPDYVSVPRPPFVTPVGTRGSCSSRARWPRQARGR